MVCITFGLIFALSLFAGEARSEEPAGGYVVQFTSSFGTDISVPYFEDFRKVDDDLREVVNLNVVKMLTYLSRTMSEMLVGKKAGKIGRMSSLFITGNLVKMGHNFINERKALKKASGTSPNFNVVMKAMFGRFLEESNQMEKAMKSEKAPKDSEALERRQQKLFGTIMEAVSHKDNTVSIYFDWTQATYRNPDIHSAPVKLGDEITEVLAQARYLGFNHVIGSIETLVNLFFWWSGKGWQ